MTWLTFLYQISQIENNSAVQLLSQSFQWIIRSSVHLFILSIGWLNGLWFGWSLNGNLKMHGFKDLITLQAAPHMWPLSQILNLGFSINHQCVCVCVYIWVRFKVCTKGHIFLHTFSTFTSFIIQWIEMHLTQQITSLFSLFVYLLHTWRGGAFSLSH